MSNSNARFEAAVNAYNSREFEAANVAAMLVPLPSEIAARDVDYDQRHLKIDGREG
jgi:hypothetical protein